MQITIALFICGALVLSDSRASWLAAITGIGCIAYRRICERFSKITAVASFIAIIAAAAVAMYYYKQPSADGRLFIWKISADMIAEAPITGHGTGTFAAKYMYSQADYFASNNNAAAVIDVADNTIYPYNEFLRITAEQGIIGLIFFIIIAVFIIQNISKCDNDRIYAAMYISLMIFSSFSYPFSAMEVAILLPLIAGSVKSKVLIDRPLNRTTVAGAICLLSSITALRNSYDNELAAIADGTYADLRITQSPNFMRRLSVDILDETNCIKINEILRIAADIIPSCELLCDLGNSYRNLGMPEMADSCYLLAHKMIPNRIMPLYQRFALYKSTDDIANARRIADEILSTKFKIAGTKTIAIKAQVSEFMQLSEYSKKIPKPIIYHHCIKDKGDY